MNKNIPFTGLSTTPSDFESQDGELSVSHNLINEDGALQPIMTPDVLRTFRIQYTSGTKTVTVDPANVRLYVHKFNIDAAVETVSTNYIAVVSGTDGNHILWCSDIYATTPTWTRITDLDDFSVNGITFSGRIINFVSDTETKWALYKDSTYEVVSISDFEYSLKIHSEPLDDGVSTTEDTRHESNVGTDFAGYFRLSGDAEAPSTEILAATSEGMKAMMARLDAAINLRLTDDEFYNKYISFGFAAVRMMDGDYIALSDMFTIGGGINAQEIQCAFENSLMTLYTRATIHKDTVAVIFKDLDKIKDFIQSVDIFISKPNNFRKINKSYTISPFKPWGDNKSDTFAIELDNMDEKEMYEEIDNLSFTRVASLNINEVTDASDSNTNPVSLQTYEATNKSISLADFQRARIGGRAIYNYNSRLHIGDYTKSLLLSPLSNISYTFSGGYIVYIPGTTTKCRVMWNWNSVEANLNDGIASFNSCSVYFKVTYKDNFNSTHTLWIESTAHIPCPPMIMLPAENVISVDMYIKELQSDQLYLYKEDIKMHYSLTGGWSYYLYLKDGAPAFLQKNKWDSTITTPQFVPDPDALTRNGQAKYDEAQAAHKANPNHSIVNRYTNQLVVSNPYNPIYLKSLDVAVGSGQILGFAAATQPVSQGQAGQTPLYAFTTEGIYPLYVNTSNGLYSATQSGSRDVIIKDDNGNYNLDSITPIDSAVLFASDRGIMLLSGNDTQCITDSLRGQVTTDTLPNLKAILSGTSDSISTYTMCGNLHDFLKQCRMAYDYRSQRLYIFSKTSTHALVFSFLSKAWGEADININYSLNSYPETVTIGVTEEDNVRYLTLYDMYQSSQDKQDVFLITRPVKLDDYSTLKRMTDVIIRGNFQRYDIGCALYGSRDLHSWHMLNSNTAHTLHNRLGSPYRYFRLLAVGKLQKGQTVTFASTQFEPSLNNKMR